MDRGAAEQVGGVGARAGQEPARRRRVAKSDVIRALIDRAGPIETGDDLIEWVDAAVGKGLGLAQKKS